MIKALKLFLIFVITSSLIVWLYNNSGKVEIISNNYLIQTDIFGLSLAIFSLFLLIFSVLLFFRIFKSIPKDFKFKKRGKYLQLANDSLDNIAEAILLGDPIILEKNSRKLKKYLNNDFFSSFMLFNSALISGDLEESKKYLKILESIPKANYIAKRAKIIFLFKNNKILDAKNLLLDLCKEYPKDIWFHDKLSRIYALEKNWKEAHGLISRLQSLPSEKKNYFANLKILSGEAPLEAFQLSESSIEVVKETMKYYLDKNELKKAINVVNKTWMKLLCIEIIELFMDYKVQSEKELLQRYKLILKNLKKNINEKSNETKLALAYASFKASIWGESQNFLDQIDKNEWDERVIDLYRKISEKTKKAILPIAKINLIEKPVWKCTSCEFQTDRWQLVCKNCSSLDTIVWSKSNYDFTKERDFFREFLQNSFGHLPKMKREN